MEHRCYGCDMAVSWIEHGRDRWMMWDAVALEGGALRVAFQPGADYTPMVRLDLDDSGDHVIISRFEVLAPPDAINGIGSDLLRTLPMSQFLAVARAQLAASRPGLTTADPRTVAQLRRRLERMREKETPPRGRRGYADSHYRRIALLYLDEYNRPGPKRGLLERLAEIEGRPVGTISTWVNTARNKGFLTDGQPGRAGAEAGPNLYEDGDQR